MPSHAPTITRFTGLAAWAVTALPLLCFLAACFLCLGAEADTAAFFAAWREAHPDAVRTHLARLHGTSTDGWQHVATYAIPYALPAMVPPLNVRPDIDLGDGIFLAGDYRATASIQGALASGRRAARAAIAHIGRTLIS